MDICSGPRCQTRRRILDLLRKKRSDGSFVGFSSEQIAEQVKLKGGQGAAAGAIRDLRGGIMESLKSLANLQCGRFDVILSGGRGYRFSEKLSVQVGDDSEATVITDMDDTSDVPNVRNGNVRDVRNDAVEIRRTWILRRLGEGDQLQAPAVAKQFKCSVKTAQRDLRALREEGRIEFVGTPRTGYYQLRNPPESDE